MSKELKITSIEDLKNIAKGEVVELPPFVGEIPFVARLKRPSMLSLVKSGKIPNSLLTQANKLFVGGVEGVASKGMENEEMLDELFDILDVICEAAFVEPSFKDLRDNGIELTDEQYMAVFTYTQQGVKSLESFRS